jgi:hypothetical protein
MSGHAATPNSEVSETVTPGEQNATTTYPGSRYGKGGSSPAGNQNDSEETKIVSASPGV